MPEVKIKIEIEVYCACCGAGICDQAEYYETSIGKPALKIWGCSKCEQKTYDNGFSDGQNHRSKMEF